MGVDPKLRRDINKSAFRDGFLHLRFQSVGMFLGRHPTRRHLGPIFPHRGVEIRRRQDIEMPAYSTVPIREQIGEVLEDRRQSYWL